MHWDEEKKIKIFFFDLLSTRNISDKSKLNAKLASNVPKNLENCIDNAQQWIISWLYEVHSFCQVRYLMDICNCDTCTRKTTFKLQWAMDCATCFFRKERMLLKPFDFFFYLMNQKKSSCHSFGMCAKLCKIVFNLREIYTAKCMKISHELKQI